MENGFICQAPDNQKGFVLPVGLMFLAILTIIGTTAMIITTADLQIGTNYKTSIQAFYAAMAGYEETRSRLPSIRQTGTPDENWRGYVGDVDLAEGAYGYDSSSTDHVYFTSLQSDMNYAAVIRHKIDSCGNILFWGDSDGDYINEINLTKGNPVEIISSSATVSGSTKTITVEVHGGIPYFEPPSALYANGDLYKTGALGVVDGTYNSSCLPKWDVVTTVNATTGKEATDWTAGTSGRPAIESLVDGYSTIYPVADVVTSLSFAADNIITPGAYTGASWGSAGDIQVTFCEGDLDIRNITGYGILAVNGDLDLRGNISWNGLIIISGETRLDGGGLLTIYGAVIANGNTTLYGQPDIYYDCMVFKNLENNLIDYRIFSWVEPF